MRGVDILIKKQILIILILIIFSPICYSGTLTNVFLRTDKEIVKTGEEFELSLNIENEKTAAYTTYIFFDENKIDFISGPEYINVRNGKIIIVWYDLQGGEGAIDGKLETLKFKAKSEGVVNFKVKGEFYDKNGEEIPINFQNLKLQISEENSLNINNFDKSNLSNTNLEILAIENTLLNPVFDNNILKYNAEVSSDTTKINILAIPENERAKVEIIGDENISEGNNKYSINVTAQNGITKRKFEINIYRRNNEEEQDYIEKENENIKQLEHAYEIEKISQEVETNHSQTINKIHSSSYKWIEIIFLIIVGIILLIISVVILKKYYRNN